MELLNNRVYSAREIEKWLVESAGMAAGSRAQRQAMKEGVSTVVGEDTYLFKRVSETHLRVYRANAAGVKEVIEILDRATFSRHDRWKLAAASVLAIALCLFGAAGLITTLVRHFILHTD
ncbi:hypothetical protein [Burkholderia sp. Ac-20365]|uniref:hypothetical protein n=1 Tax=Burkholderia sp. Ac-20365 TaxID=2703897 RepID=UPI00197C306A|nr:hypothetical protein [Burkholderia sp. Ac-20365]MBN3761221.1 hypothetical protein [Burkholderia sp. Ac-20365]